MESASCSSWASWKGHQGEPKAAEVQLVAAKAVQLQILVEASAERAGTAQEDQIL